MLAGFNILLKPKFITASNVFAQLSVAEHAESPILVHHTAIRVFMTFLHRVFRL
jgi:hypothetical protein